MAFNSYEELAAAVQERRQDLLTLEVDLGGRYSPEYEAAKAELQQAKSMRSLLGEQGFLADNLEAIQTKVDDLKPETNSVWARYRRLDLGDWAKLVKSNGLTPVEQYEKVLPQTFVGVWGTDPNPDEKPEDWAEPEPLSTDGALLSSKGNLGILPGGALHQVVQAFMSWQNSGGDVNIRPTKSGLV